MLSDWLEPNIYHGVKEPASGTKHQKHCLSEATSPQDGNQKPSSIHQHVGNCLHCHFPELMLVCSLARLEDLEKCHLHVFIKSIFRTEGFADGAQDGCTVRGFVAPCMSTAEACEPLLFLLRQPTRLAKTEDALPLQRQQNELAALDVIHYSFVFAEGGQLKDIAKLIEIACGHKGYHAIGMVYVMAQSINPSCHRPRTIIAETARIKP